MSDFYMHRGVCYPKPTEKASMPRLIAEYGEPPWAWDVPTPESLPPEAIGGIWELDMGGIAFTREPREYGWEMEDGRITAIILDGDRFVKEARYVEGA